MWETIKVLIALILLIAALVTVTIGYYTYNFDIGWHYDQKLFSDFQRLVVKIYLFSINDFFKYIFNFILNFNFIFLVVIYLIWHLFWPRNISIKDIWDLWRDR